MAESLPFVREHTDLSTDRGFQFEFHCDRCRGGARSRVHPWPAGAAGGLVEAAAVLLGGVFGGGDRPERATAWNRARAQAYDDAVAEIRGTFAQCPRCSQWVCRKSCWSTRRGVCKDCAPDPETAPAEQPSARRGCPRCGKTLPAGARFCPACGEPVT